MMSFIGDALLRLIGQIAILWYLTSYDREHLNHKNRFFVANFKILLLPDGRIHTFSFPSTKEHKS